MRLVCAVLLLFGAVSVNATQNQNSCSVKAEKRSLHELRTMAKEGNAYRIPAKLRSRFSGGNRLEVSGGNEQGVAEHKSESRRQAPRRITAEGGNVFGFIASSTTSGSVPGMYEITADGYKFTWADPMFEDFSILASNAWYDDGKIKGTGILELFNYIMGYYYYEIDFYTGERTRTVDYFSWANCLFLNCDINLDGDTVYGYVFNMEDGITYWASAPANEIYNVKLIAPAENTYCYSLCRGYDNGVFYGVNDSQEFVSINISDGAQTVISKVPDAESMSKYNTGLVWNPEAKKFYWNGFTTERQSSLYTITDSGEFTKSFDFPTGDQFSYFITTDSSIKDNQPLKPTFESASFANGSLSGKATFVLPQYFGDGSALPPDLVCTALLDGDYYDTVMGKPGSKVTVDYTVANRGFYILGLNVTVNGVTSPTSNQRLYIGPDDPKAPANVSLEDGKVEWKAVTEGVNGGYIDAAAITYTVKINDEVVGTTASTSLEVNLPADRPLAGYTAYVTAKYDKYESQPGKSNTVVVGVAFELPVSFAPTPEEFGLMTVYDANHDGSTWRYNTTMNAASTSYILDPDSNMDDYLFLPPVNLPDADKYYSLSFETGLLDGAYTEEYVEAVVATAPTAAAVKSVVIGKFKPTACPDYGNDYSDWNQLSGLIKVDNPGEYYIGIHCISKGNMLGIAARNFKIDNDNIAGSSPVAAIGLSAVPAPEGAMKAAVSFTIPTVTVDGTEIPAATSIQATIAVNGDEASTVDGLPGQVVNAEVETIAGYNEISVVLSRDGFNSPIASVTIYTGPSVPATPTNVNIVSNPDMMGALITWDAVTEADIPGAYIDPQTVDYIIYTFDGEGWYPYVEGIDDTYYEFELDEGDPQAQYYFGVASHNENGSNDRIRYATDVLGTPYALPFNEGFSKKGFTTSAWTMPAEFNGQEYAGSVYLDVLSGIDPALNNDKDYAILSMSETGGPEMELLGMPRFSTEGHDDAVLTIDVVKGPDAADLSIFGIVYGDNTPVNIGTVKGHTETVELATVKFDLPAALLGQKWVQVYFEMNFVFFDDYVALSRVNVSSSTGVESIAAGSKGYVTSAPGHVVIRGFEGSDYTVYALDGRIVARGGSNGAETTVAADSGIYIVSVGGERVKLIVR